MKKRKFDGGGDVDDTLLSNKDNAKSIGDDTRSRAKKFLETGKKDEETKPKIIPKTIPKAAPKVESKSKSKSEPESKNVDSAFNPDSPNNAVTKSKSETNSKDYSDQNDRRSQQSGYESSSNQKRLKEYDKPLEEVHPEDYVPGGMLKNIARRAIKSAAKDITPKTPQLGGPRKQLGYDKEAVRKIDEPARAARTESSGAMKDTFKPEEIREGFKKGGKVAGKLATRGYGISKHGKAK